MFLFFATFPKKAMIQVGGNTSCVLVRFDNNQIVILDSGTGIRKLGNEIIAQGVEQFANIYIALSHSHLDHIHGFPFFKPAYDPKRHSLYHCAEKKGWGHSSWEQAVEVAERAGVKRLALFHHDPEHSDTFLFNMESE